jgi:uncharacterized protein
MFHSDSIRALRPVNFPSEFDPETSMPNRLAQETSPYLQQHADNPVDWHPWGEEALALAREQNKPILLSVGYSACHWCHVMAHESFEDPEVARLMNEHFVNIKVDREERPDLDQIYQTAHAMLTQRSGGWPLTMFLTPDQKPFFGGTYFPKRARHGLPAFPELLSRIAEIYREQNTDIARQNGALLEALEHTLPRKSADSRALDAAPLELAQAELKSAFDMVNGGFGAAPKFPHPNDLEFCLRRYAATGSGDARQIATLTLTKMAEGGIYDQIGGGFARYSVDPTWTIPHFEKMLYDNGPLLRLYADAWVVMGDALYKRVAEDTAAWVMREMQAPEGGYYSTLDADSEHEEGKFYVWTPDEAGGLLTPEEYAVLAPHYGLDGAPNFENHSWHLRVVKPLQNVALKLRLSLEEAGRLLESGRTKLFATRERRIRPGRDEKILTSWNGLMIKGMAHAGRVLGRPEWVASARRACDFVRATLYRDGRLLATCKDGRAHLNAYLDDYAFMLDAVLYLLEAEFRASDLAFAQELAETLLAQFEDPAEGGFFFTSHDHEKLIHRLKPAADNATPSGNGVAVLALQRLGHLIGEHRYLDAAERALRLFAPILQRHPNGHTTLAMGLAEHLEPPAIVILRGNASDMVPWERQLATRYLPTTLTVPVPEGLADLPPTMDKPVGKGVAAWICVGSTCLPPIDRPEALDQTLTMRAAA